MNRIRHAYLEVAPELEPYFVTSRYDDDAGMLLSALGRRTPRGAGAGLSRDPGLVGVASAVVLGAIAGIAELGLGLEHPRCLLVGAGGLLLGVTVCNPRLADDPDAHRADRGALPYPGNGGRLARRLGTAASSAGSWASAKSTSHRASSASSSSRAVVYGREEIHVRPALGEATLELRDPRLELRDPPLDLVELPRLASCARAVA